MRASTSPPQKRLERQQHRAGRRDGKTPGMAERRVATKLSMSKLKRRGERILPCAMPESTQGEETEPPRRWDTAGTCQSRPMTPKSRDEPEWLRPNKSQKNLLNVDERCISVLMAAEAHGVHKAEGHSVGTPTETALERLMALGA